MTAEATPLDDEALLLARYRRLGEAFLDDVRGSFAIALVDPPNRRALFARSDIGDRAASYVLKPELVAFCVGVDGGGPADLLDVSGVSRDVDATRMAAFFAFDEHTGARTFFSDVRCLRPGEMLVVESHSTHLRSLNRVRLDLRLSLRWEEAVETFSALLRESVRHCVRGSRRTSVWVSGGLDSTPIAALAAQSLPPVDGRLAVEGISWQVSDAESDERALVEALSRHTGVPVSWVPCDDALVFADLATWPVHPASPEQNAYRVFHERSYARGAALGADLVLTGAGGDDLYADARRWFWTLVAAGQPLRAIDRLRETSSRQGWPVTLRQAVVAALLPKARRLRPSPPSFLTEQAQRLLAVRDRWPPDLGSARRPRQAERLLSVVDANGEPLENWYALRHGLVRASPLRDFDLVQFMLAIPDHFVEQGLESRSILRAAIRGLVPEAIRNRRGKATFYEIFRRGFAGGRLSWTARLLRSKDALWRPHVEAAVVERWLGGDLRDDGDRAGLLQCIYAELWHVFRSGRELASLVR